MGSYELDFTTGRWVSSSGLDAIFGIDGSFSRTIDGWSSLIHPAEREMLLDYLAEEVVGRGRPFEKAYRIVRADTHEERWVLGRGTLEEDGSGRRVRMLGTISDITDRVAADAERTRLALAAVASEAYVRALIDGAPDGVLVGDATGRLIEINPAGCALLGGRREDFLGRTLADVVPADDLERKPAAYERLEVGKAVRLHRRFRRADGTLVPVELHVSRLPDGRIQAYVRDMTERVAIERELRAAVLTQRETAERLESLADQLNDAVFLWSSDGQFLDANAAAIERLGYSRDELATMTPADITAPEADVDVSAAMAAIRRTGFGIVETVHLAKDGTRIPTEVSSRIVDLDGQKAYLSVGRDLTERHHAEGDMKRLSTAIEQTSDAVVITDTTGAIQYVNPAFERVTGYARDEVLGQNPRVLKSGIQGPAFYAAMWATLTSGKSFVGDMTNRHKDGSLFQEEAVISPIVDEAGAITSYVAVKRNVTLERASEAALARLTRERAQIAESLAELRVLPSAAETASEIAQHIVRLADVTTVRIAYFTDGIPAIPLAFVRADGVSAPLTPVTPARGRELRERAEAGPWVEAWAARPSHTDDRLFRELGVVAAASAPIRHHGKLIGLLGVTSSREQALEQLTEALPALLEFAGVAGVLLGPAIAELTESGEVRTRIARIIREAAFEPVFQPIVDLATGAHAGYEALTRFSSGSRPDLVFADARATGLEARLEIATLAAAIEASARLPAGAWLSLNVSPTLVTRNGSVARLLQMTNRPVVLEVTEHVSVADYPAVRAAIEKLGPQVRVAVDDAGAGVANFSHIVELRPAFVKLDIGLVSGIDTDRIRQALVVGLQHFARSSASETIAEGVETELELATLRTLGVPFAQGYLLGRPARVEEWAGRTTVGTRGRAGARTRRRGVAVRS